MDRFKSQHNTINFKNNYTADDVLSHMSELKDSEDKEYTKRDNQIKDFIYKISREQVR